ncbi:hypothetical protein DY000_02045922 [Brassica cretica]|uniref:Uncharacterized protein n=1 Tax=Brassica cretica TaxID=69181 RepID=A0ABQ7ENF3_BRACR|nr:hypothetical protein DY000_02045922 [Brassica cretica]
MNFRENSEDHQFVGKVLGIYRGRTSSGYFDGFSLGIFRWTFRWSNPRKFRRNVPQNFHREFPRNGAFRKFRGMSPSVYSEEGVPRYIPRKCSSEISEGSFPRNFKKK